MVALVPIPKGTSFGRCADFVKKLQEESILDLYAGNRYIIIYKIYKNAAFLVLCGSKRTGGVGAKPPQIKKLKIFSIFKTLL